jgi:hypothetical protein
VCPVQVSLTCLCSQQRIYHQGKSYTLNRVPIFGRCRSDGLTRARISK